MLAATLGSCSFELESVDAGIASVINSSGINDSIASVSSGGEGLVSELGADSAAADFWIASAEVSVSSAIAFSTAVVCVRGGSSRSVKLDSGNGFIGVSISSLSEENAASGSKN